MSFTFSLEGGFGGVAMRPYAVPTKPWALQGLLQVGRLSSGSTTRATAALLDSKL